MRTAVVRKDERRAEKLRQVGRRIKNGSSMVAQMTAHFSIPVDSSLREIAGVPSHERPGVIKPRGLAGYPSCLRAACRCASALSAAARGSYGRVATDELSRD